MVHLSFYFQVLWLVQKRVFSHFQSNIPSGAFWLCFRELDSLCASPPSGKKVEILSSSIRYISSSANSFKLIGSRLYDEFARRRELRLQLAHLQMHTFVHWERLFLIVYIGLLNSKGRLDEFGTGICGEVLSSQ